MTTIHVHDHVFPTATEGLPACGATDIVEVQDGATVELRIAPVANQLGDTRVRMLAYNGSIPGPTLRVAQGSEIAVRVRNDGECVVAHSTSASTPVAVTPRWIGV